MTREADITQEHLDDIVGEYRESGLAFDSVVVVGGTVRFYRREGKSIKCVKEHQVVEV